MQHVNKIKKIQKNSGFGLLDSLVALVIFGTVLMLYVRQTEDINISKKAKTYATKSISDAKEFAKQLQTFVPLAQSQYQDVGGVVYKNETYYEKYKNSLRSSPNKVITLTPQNWDSKYSTANMFGEKACLALAYKASSDTMYGIMFYVDDNEKNYKDKSKLIQRALLSLQGKGAAYVDSSVAQAINQNRYGNNTISPTSWSPNNLNTLVAGSSICGGKIAKNSIIINMDLLPEFNQRLIAVSGVLKSSSQNNTNQTYLPNHLFNANTLKSNLTVESSVILDKNPDNLITKLISVMGATQAAALASSQNYINNGCTYTDTGTKTPPPAYSSKNCSLSIISADRLYPNRTCRVGNNYSCPSGAGSTNQTACADNPSANSALTNIGCTYVSSYNRGAYHDGECTNQEISEGSKANYMYGLTCPLGIGKMDSIAMNIAYGAGGNTTLNVGKNESDDTTTTFLSSAIQPNTSIRSGSICQAEELGKVAITGAENAGTNALSRSIVSCTKNATLCPTTGYCYLPSKDNLITYQAAAGFGLEDASGIFKCPAYAPYAIKSAFNSAPNVDVFVNDNGPTTGSILTDVKIDDGHANHPVISLGGAANQHYLSRYYNCSGSCDWNGLWWYAEYLNFNDALIIHGNKLTIPQGSTEIIYDGQSDLSTPRGYKITNTFTNCNNVCPNLNSSLGGTWGDINSIANAIIINAKIPAGYVNIPSNKCACARVGGESKSWNGVTYSNLRLLGVALIENTQPHLTSITCSNSPSYNIQ